ncbi:MAG: hypothetical protein ACOYXM_16665 [Actinomycetota bacterium]
MPFWNRKAVAADRISSEALADFGRFEFLGREQSGVFDAYALVSDLVSLSYPPDGPGFQAVVAELRRHAQKGEWEKVGAWKYVREFLSDSDDVGDLIDGGLLAIHRMRVTNLSIHLAPIDTPRYTELTGGPPPNDGFFGPPVFDSDFGPTRQYYFDHAISTAAARQISRVPAAAGVEPGPIDASVRAMWDFGMLVYRGPLVVAPDISFEPNVVKPAVEAATGVDHQIFAERLVDAALDRESVCFGPWTAIGAARFIEDYLDRDVAESDACTRAIDCGLTQLVQMGIVGVGMTPELLTPRQRERLSAIGS